ncbi:hypothetical protein [Halopseudomonas pelagia]|uniref:hypothetical protein n=1 Tax=Halopseudomonas pelagia TaxID=553151 RepID=UPI0030DC06F2|tara:strand:+ start:1624 stop:1989 length:366 start_codon:yes stop_codon:yes gene_type:complete
MRKIFISAALCSIPLSASAEVYDKVISIQAIFATIIVFLFVFLIYAKTKIKWIFWPFITILFIDLAGAVHFQFIENEIFILASKEIGTHYKLFNYAHIGALLLLLYFSVFIYLKAPKKQKT